MNITLDQWQTLITIVEQDSYANAAEYLNKSQSTLSYAIQKMESNLNIQIFKIEGRKAVLTSAGEVLYRRALHLISAAKALEDTAKELSNHWQANINLAVDTVFPDKILFSALQRFSEEHPLTRINLSKTVLSGSTEALIKREAQLSITGSLSPGFIAEPLLDVAFIPAAAPEHPLHHLDRVVTFADLQQHRQLVLRDSGSQNLNAGWLGAMQRWTFNDLASSITAAIKGFGFAWYAQNSIQAELDKGALKILPLAQGATRSASLYLIYADNELASLSCLQLGSYLLEEAKRYQSA